MDIDTSKLDAELTGDVIGSSKLSELSRRSLYTMMQRGSEALRSLFGDIIPLDVDIFRGDSWQMLLSAPEKSFRIGLLYRLFLKTSMQERTDRRFGVGIGPISFIPGERVSEGEGVAFRLSGQALQEMGSFCSLGFRIHDPEGFRSQWLDSTAVLLDAIVLSWTEKQAISWGISCCSRIGKPATRRSPPFSSSMPGYTPF